MKQLEGSMASDVPVLSSVQAWLGHELDSRGIDASVYSRYIVSLLQHDDLDGEHQEVLGLPGLRKGISGTATVTTRPKAKPKKAERKKTDDMSLDELRKMAAIDCLLSASEESSGIESLVEELYLKLKELQIAGVTSESPKRVLQEIQLQSGDTVNSEDPKQKYYAAFPALSDRSGSGSQPQNSTDGKVWAEVAGRQTDTSGAVDSPEECNNNKVRRPARKTPRSPAKEEKERQNFESKYRESEGRRSGCKGLFISSPNTRNRHSYSCSPGSGAKQTRKNSPGSNNSSKQNSPSTRYHSNRTRNIDATRGRALFQESGRSGGGIKGRRSDPGILPPTFIVPKVSPKSHRKSRSSLNRCRSEEASDVKDESAFLHRCLSGSVGAPDELPHSGDVLGELELLVEDLMWYTQPLDTIILPSPVPKQRLYQRNSEPGEEQEEMESDSEAAKSSHGNIEINIVEQGNGALDESTDTVGCYGNLSPMEEFEDGDFCLKEGGLEKSRYLEVIESCQREDEAARCKGGTRDTGDESPESPDKTTTDAKSADDVKQREDQPSEQIQEPSVSAKKEPRVAFRMEKPVPDLQFLDDHFKDVSRESSYGNLQEVFSLGFGYVPPNTPVHHKDMQNDDALGLSSLVQLAEHMHSLSQESDFEFELWSRKTTADEAVDDHWKPEVVSQEEISVQCKVLTSGTEASNAGGMLDDITHDLESSEEFDTSNGLDMFPLLYDDLHSTRTDIPTPLSTCSGDGLHTEDTYLLSSDEEELDEQNLFDYDDQNLLEGEPVHEEVVEDKQKEGISKAKEDSLSKYAVALGHLDILKQLDLDSSGDSEALLASLQESEEEQEMGEDYLDQNGAATTCSRDPQQQHLACNPCISSLWWDISEQAGTWACREVTSIWGFGGGHGWGMTDLPICNCAASQWSGGNPRLDLASLWNKCENVPSHGCRRSPLREFFSPKVEHGQESRIWDINIQRKLDFTSPLDHTRALFSPVYISQVNLSSIHMTFIKGGLYGNEWDRILDVGDSGSCTPVHSLSQAASPQPFVQSASMFRLQSESDGLFAWLHEDLSDQGLRLPGSVDLLPSENSAFTGVARHSSDPTFTCTPLHHVQSEPIFSQGGAAVGRHCVDCQYRMIQVKHLYKSDTSILRQLGLATGTDAEETHQQDSIEYSPDRHFVPIQTAQECVIPSPPAILNGEENPLSEADQGEIAKPSTNRSSSYQLYLEEEEEGASDTSFVPSFRVQKQCEKCAQTGESPILQASTSSRDSPSLLEEEEREEEAQEKALAERLLTDVRNVLDLEMDKLLIGEDLMIHDVTDLDTSLMLQQQQQQEASSDYESMVQDTSTEDYQANVDVSHLWNNSTPTAMTKQGGSMANIWDDSLTPITKATATVAPTTATATIWDDTPSFGISNLWQETTPPKEETNGSEPRNNRYMSIWSLGVDSQTMSIPLEFDDLPGDGSNLDDHHQPDECIHAYIEESMHAPTGEEGLDFLAQSLDTLTGQSDTQTITEEQGDLILDALTASIHNFEDYIYQDYKDPNAQTDSSEMFTSHPQDQSSWPHEEPHQRESQVKWSTGEDGERWYSCGDSAPWQCDADSGQETLPEWMGDTTSRQRPLLSIGGSTGGEAEPDWLSGQQANDDYCWDSENDMIFTLESQHVPSESCVFSTDLETQWLADPTAFSVQVPRKKFRHRHGGADRKPCSFFLEGSCRRTDCKFAHDMSHITCRFWEEGECFKGVTCPFLHGYASAASHSAPVSQRRPRRKKKEEFNLQKHDFPSLQRDQDDSSSMSASSDSERKRSVPSQDSADSEPIVSRGYREDLGSSNDGEKIVLVCPRVKSLGRKKKQRSKVKAKSLPIDIQFKKKS